MAAAAAKQGSSFAATLEQGGLDAAALHGMKAPVAEDIKREPLTYSRLITGTQALGRALSGSVVTLDGARDNWFGPWPPPSLLDGEGAVPTEERRPRA